MIESYIDVEQMFSFPLTTAKCLEASQSVLLGSVGKRIFVLLLKPIVNTVVCAEPELLPIARNKTLL